MKLLVIALSIIGCLAKPESAKDDGTCQTKFCKSTGKRMKNMLDKTIDPCDNFFKYSCGNWIKENPLKNTTQFAMVFFQTQADVNNKLKNLYNSPSGQNSKSEAVRKTVTAFNACVNAPSNQRLIEDTYRRLLSRENELGGCPMVIQSEFDETKANHEIINGIINRKYDEKLFFLTDVRRDIKVANENVIYLTQSKLEFGKEVYKTPQNHTKKVNGYKKFIKDSAKYLVQLLGKSTTDAQIDQAVEEIWALETKLNAILQPGKFTKQAKKENYHPKTVAQLKREYPNINWDPLFHNLFDYTGIRIPNEAKIIVRTPKYFEKLNTLLTTIPIRVMTNYAYWRAIIKKYALHGTEEMRANLLEYKKATEKGVNKLKEREAKCLDELNTIYDGLGLANSHLFIQEHFSSQAKDKITNMITIMKKEYKKRLDRTSWLKPDELVESKCKVDLMVEGIGFPDWLNSVIDLDYYYEELAPMNSNNLENQMKIKQFNVERSLRTYKDYTYGIDWPNPSAVNAFYQQEDNIMVFTAGILQEPFFHENYPDYLNYGAIGMIIGHEIAHGFDRKGSKFDSSKRVRNWWSNSTIKHFKTLEKCFIDQFTSYRIPELIKTKGDKARLNGTNFAAEILGDYIGVTTGIDAFIELEKTTPQLKLPEFEDFTTDQMYFLSWAQSFCGHETPEFKFSRNTKYEHPDEENRINGAYSNSLAFIKAYKCGCETKMNNGDKRCHIY